MTLFQLLVELHITTSETGLDCYQQKETVSITLQVAGQLKTYDLKKFVVDICPLARCPLPTNSINSA